jgi:hypothetical protein
MRYQNREVSNRFYKALQRKRLEMLKPALENPWDRKVQYAPPPTPYIELELAREPTNRHDNLALKVIFEGDMLGYVTAADAAFISPIMDAYGLKSIQAWVGDISIEMSRDEMTNGSTWIKASLKV